MNILGMGTMEVLIILLVAFIFLGPERMVDAARLLGKAAREARRMSASLADIGLDDEIRPGKPTGVHHARGSLERESSEAAPTASRTESEASPDDDDAPVAFRAAPAATAQDDAHPTADGERG